MPIEQYSHLALYVCFFRLLHSGHLFGEQTSEIANQLIVQFYKDVEIFYKNSLTFKLHLHLHLSSMYNTHGALCHLGCFSQESLIGFVSDNHHGSRFHGNSIVHFYNIDFCLHDKKKQNTVVDGPCDPTDTPRNSYGYLKEFHSRVCGCDHFVLCVKAYRRYIIHQRMYHSLLYTKRQSSISYIVQYISTFNDPKKRFGIVDLFFISNGFSYAAIKYYPFKQLYSEFFQGSSYYQLLKEPIDRLYFVLDKCYCELEIVSVERILNHCIVIEKKHYLLVTNILSYNEHD